MAVAGIPVQWALAALLLLNLHACAAVGAIGGERPEYNAIDFPQRLHHVPASAYFDAGPQRDLAQAAADGDIEGMEQALAAGAEVDAVGNDGMTPLYWAMARYSPEGMKFLLEHGADPNRYTRLPEHYDRPKTAAMWLAIRMDDPIYLRTLLEYGGNPDLQWKSDSISILTYAVSEPLFVTELLVKYDANVNHSSAFNGKTPLFSAMTGSRFDIALHLLRAGADPTQRDKPFKRKRGSSPIDVLGWFGNRATSKAAARAAYPEFVKELKDRGFIPPDWEYDPEAPIDYDNYLSLQ